jgi:hypothetical protein
MEGQKGLSITMINMVVVLVIAWKNDTTIALDV